MTQRLLRALIALVLVACVLPSCAARRLREAQDHFNRAATAELQAGEGVAAGGDDVRGAASASADYALAHALLDQEISKHASELRDENLLGTALVLKSLCLWRIDALASDRATGVDEKTAAQLGRETEFGKIEDRIAQEKLTLGTRDAVLLKALPGLRDHERAFRAHDYATAARFFKSSDDTLEKALADTDPPANHPVRVYVRLAQMRSVRGWLSANYALNRHPDPATQGAKQLEVTRALHERFRAVAGALDAQTKTSPVLSAQVQDLAKAVGVTWPLQ